MRKLIFPVLLAIVSAVFLLFRLPDVKVLKVLRVPELMMALGFGGTLGVCGVLFQGTLKNPLAEPYTLGVASGAGFGATLFVFLSLPGEIGALLGGLTSVLLLALASKVFRDSLSILLFGVGISIFLSSGIVLLYALMPSHALQNSLFFTLGYVTPVSFKLAVLLLAASVALLAGALFKSRTVDLLSLGDEIAFFSGIDPGEERVKLLLVSSLVLSLFVSYCGIVGFVGIIVPHVARFLGFRCGADLVVQSFFGGALTLTAAQLLAKNVAPPLVLPAGVVTAVVGVPFFLYVLWRYSGGRG